MDIRSTPSGYTPKTQGGRARETNADNANRPGAGPPLSGEEGRTDRVELSDAARELHARLQQPAAEPSGLSPERIMELAGRIRSGYYDRGDVIDRILARVMASPVPSNSSE